MSEREMLRKLITLIPTFAHMFFVTMSPAQADSDIKFVFVIVMENTDANQVYGNSKRARYINESLAPRYARAANFNDPLPLEIPSEPHYIWMEAGTNVFSDHVFVSDDDPSSENSTASKEHLVTQIKNSGRVTWMTYQEDINSNTGRCPVLHKFPYAPKHNPFVFFHDVSGNPPRKDNPYCIEHTKPYSSFAADLAANKITNYVYITPNLCHDMHGDKRCRPKEDRVTAGDKWLASELPRIIEWVHKNSGVIFLVWDEGDSTSKIPFFAIGPGVKPGYESHIEYDHGSLVRSIEEIFGLQFLPEVSSKNSLVDLFQPGAFP